MNEQQAFEEALEIQAVGAGTPTLTLDDVRGRARSIRRRRTAIASTGAAVLVAAAVLPVALLVGSGSDTDSLPPADATPTVIDTANPVPVQVDQRGTWVVGDAIHPAVGEPFTPEVTGDLVSVHWLVDGRWVLGVDPGGGSSSVVVTDSAGAVLTTYDAGAGGLASDDVGGAVTWFGTDGEPRVLVTDEPKPFALPAAIDGRRSAPEPIEVLPGCSPTDCAVLVEVYDDSPGGATQYSVSHTGEVLSLDSLGMLSITDVSSDGALVAGAVSADERGQGFCSGVVILATGERLWRSCDLGSLRFSPDGSKVLAIDASADGFAHSYVQVVKTDDGELFGEYRRRAIFDETWVSAEEYLVSTQRADGTDQLELVTLGQGSETVLSQDGIAGDPSPLRLAGR